MEQERDYLDRLIVDSFEEIPTEGRFGEQYNRKLLSKLNGENIATVKSPGRFRTTAMSLITAGILLGFMYTSEVQTRITSIECKIKYDYSIIKHNINIDKFFLGE